MVSQKPKYCKNFKRNSHWGKLSMIMVWEHYCNASPKPEFFLFSLFIFSFISQLIWVHLGWNFHRWFSIQKTSKLMYNWSFLFVVLHRATLLPSTFKPISCVAKHRWSFSVTLPNDIFIPLPSVYPYILSIIRQWEGRSAEGLLSLLDPALSFPLESWTLLKSLLR